MWRLRGGGLSRSYLLINVQIRASAGPRAGTENHGEPQKTLVSTNKKDLNPYFNCIKKIPLEFRDTNSVNLNQVNQIIILTSLSLSLPLSCILHVTTLLDRDEERLNFVSSSLFAF